MRLEDYRSCGTTALMLGDVGLLHGEIGTLNEKTILDLAEDLKGTSSEWLLYSLHIKTERRETKANSRASPLRCSTI